MAGFKTVDRKIELPKLSGVILGRVKCIMITKRTNHWLDKINKYVYNEVYRLFKMENRNVKI